MLLCAVLLTASLSAQEFGQRKGFRGIVAKKDKPTLLNEVEVSTSAAGDTYATAARTVTVLTAKEIQELPVNTINEVLEYVCWIRCASAWTAGCTIGYWCAWRNL